MQKKVIIRFINLTGIYSRPQNTDYSYSTFGLVCEKFTVF